MNAAPSRAVRASVLVVALLATTLAGCSSSGAPPTHTVNVAACQSDKKTVEIAVEAFYARNREYPTAIDDPTHSATTLVGAGMLRSAPTATVAEDGYVIGYRRTADGYIVTPASCG